MSRHERRWASDTVPGGKILSAGSSPGNSTDGAEEFVEVTLDLQDDDTIILRSVEPASAVPHADRDSAETTPMSSSSRSPSIARSSSHGRLRQFSQELKAEAVAKARQLSQELKAELRRFSWSHGHGNRAGGASVSAEGSGGTSGALDSALAARARRRQRAQLDRTHSGTHKALRGLRFISKANGVDGWNEVQSNFDKLARDGYLSRSDFAQCIGMKDSKEFALELYDALSRRRRMNAERISREELYEFWSQITDQSFDSRLQIFFDMVDKNEDGRIAEAEVKEVREIKIGRTGFRMIGKV